MIDEPADEYAGCTPLLVKVMQDGNLVLEDTIDQMRERCRAGIASLPDTLLEIGERKDIYESFFEVKPSDKLNALLEECRHMQKDV